METPQHPIATWTRPANGDCQKMASRLIKLLSTLMVILQFLLQASTSTSVPEQIHISFGDDHHSMVVMWASRDPANGTVWYGTSADNMPSSAGSAVARLPEDDYKAYNYIHRAVLKDLLGGTRHFYRVVSVGSDAVRQASRVYSFKTVGLKQAGIVRYLVYGDFGVYVDEDRAELMPTFRYLEAVVKSAEYTAVWHVGDIAYDLFMDKGKVGDDFLRHIQPVAANVSYMTCPGNHEREDDFIHYRTRFSSPGIPWPIPLNRMWYSYDIGLVHFISFSTEVYFDYNEDYVCEQFYWLLQDLILANDNRDRVPWIVAMGHRPMYCSNMNTNDCTGIFISRWVQHGLEDLFYAQGVDLIIEAHEHSYERLLPVYKDRIYNYNYNNPGAPVHVISGAAGNFEGVNHMMKGEKWSAFRVDTVGWLTVGILEIHNRTHLHFKEKKVTDNSTIDKFWLVQTYHRPFVSNISCFGAVKKTHPSCTCPALYRYVYYILILACVGLALLVTALVLCYVSRLQDVHRAIWMAMWRARRQPGRPSDTTGARRQPRRPSDTTADHTVLIHSD